MSAKVYLVQEEYFKECNYVYLEDSRIFFAYEEAPVTNSTLKRATGFSDNKEIVRAMEYAEKNGKTMVPVSIGIRMSRTNIDRDDIYRKSALEKLTENEKRVLGL